MIGGGSQDAVRAAVVRADGYRELRPGPALAPFVDCFWERRGSVPTGVSQRARILPDGRIDLLFVLGEAPAGSAGGCFAVGAMRRALVLGLAGQIDTLGVRFAAGAAGIFLGVPAIEITDATVALEELWGRLAFDLEERIRAVAPGRRVPVVEAELEKRLKRTEPPPLALAASTLIERRSGRVRVSELCQTLGVGERRLRRVFAGAVGLSPKEACRVARFACAARLLRRYEGVEFSRVAYGAGYYDQPHFIREFRELSGLTPGTYLNERRAVRSVQSPTGALGHLDRAE